MILNISHVVVIGCSYAYGDGLQDPKTQSWAGLLGKKLSVPVVNLSTKGGGNDRVQRRLVEYYYRDLDYDNHPLYIISYSHSSRREEYIAENKNYMVVDLHPDSVDDLFTKPCLINYDEEIQARRKMLIQNTVHHFLKNNNVNYLVTDYMPYSTADIAYLKTKFSKMYDTVHSDSTRLADFVDLVRGLPLLPCLHDGPEAQHILADYIYAEILNRYDTINKIDAPFTTLLEYNNYYDSITGHGHKDWI